MTLIVGLHSNNSIVIAAETEESAGIAAKRQVYKLSLAKGADWAVIVGGAGDAAICENASRRLCKKLESYKTLTEDNLTDAIDDVLATVHTKYIDPVPNSEGVALIIGAICGTDMFLISTHKRTLQVQENYAYAGIGADLAIYFLEQLYQENGDWEYAVKLAGFVLQEVKYFSQYCGGGSVACVLQPPPNPRWRSIGDDVMEEIEKQLRRKCDFIKPLATKLRDMPINPKKLRGAPYGYTEEGQE